MRSLFKRKKRFSHLWWPAVRVCSCCH